MTAGAADHWDICLSTLRETDRDRYLACLLSPADTRGPLAALYAFHAEIARIRDVIHQPLAGEIRLQWWRDLLSGTAEGESNANPIAAGLLATIDAYRLPRDVLANMTEARIFDLYDDPMPDRNALEGYAGETAAALIQLAGLVLDAPAAMQQAETAGHAGVAQAIAGILLLLPLHRKRGQVYLPLDILSATGLDRDTFLAEPEGPQHRAAIEAFAGLGLDHLSKAKRAGGIPAALLPAFLPVAIAEPVLQAAARAPEKALRGTLQAPQWRRQLRMLRTLALKRL
ncbi:phytoene/squalene synthase family protein [Allorhizobium pseudoryzae]|uniref:phytoene/squalene synthase family protein n=1 Tax=Allorhizobium pseudoryzae TaxID=379684 RepID=UPI003D0882C4